MPGAPEIISTAQAALYGTWNQACGGFSGLLNGRSDINAREYTGKSGNVFDRRRERDVVDFIKGHLSCLKQN